MEKEEWFQHKWHYLKRFSLFALIGIVLAIAAAITKITFLGIGILFIFPLIFWLIMVPMLHWKDRYIGEKSTLWGALILIEQSGWLKIVYWFRHILPDYWGHGRYAETNRE